MHVCYNEKPNSGNGEYIERHFVSSILDVPIVGELAPGALNYGRVLLVEFEPHSLWYDASFTIAADALRKGIRTQYHTFIHIPDDIRHSLTKCRVDVKAVEDKKTLQIIDSYTIQTGLGTPELPSPSRSIRSMAESLKVSDWSIADAQAMKAPSPEELKWLHVDDNISALANYNDEKAILNYWRTRIIPGTRRFQLAFLNALLVKTHSDSFYQQFESLCDGIVDFRSREEGNSMIQEARVRVIHGKAYDSRWRQLELTGNGEVKLASLQ